VKSRSRLVIDQCKPISTIRANIYLILLTHIISYAGILFPSVTTVIGNTLPVPDALAAWKLRTGKNGVETMRAAQIVGTLVHYRVLNTLSPSLLQPPEFDPDNLPKGAIEKIELAELMWSEFAANLKIGYPRHIEKLLFNREHRFCGTPDMVCPVDDIYTLVDLKTSRELHEAHRIQLGGYHELLGRTPERGMLVSIHPGYGNHFMRAHSHIIERRELDNHADRFLELVKEFHKRNLTEKLAEEFGVLGEEKQIVGND